MCRQSTDAGAIHPGQPVNRAAGPTRTTRCASQPSPAGPFHPDSKDPAQGIDPVRCLGLAGPARRLPRTSVHSGIVPGEGPYVGVATSASAGTTFHPGGCRRARTGIRCAAGALQGGILAALQQPRRHIGRPMKGN